MELKPLLRLAPLAALVLAAGAAYASGLADTLSLSGLAAHRAAWTATAHSHPAQSLAVFVAVYAIVTASGAPLALVLTLAGGLIFGTLAGGAASAVAATLASLISYAAARTALGAWLARRAEARPKLAGLIQAMKDGGFLLIVGARLLPVMPFAAVNLAAGVAKVPLRPFLAATILCAIPTSLVYAGLGAGLGDSLDEGSLMAALRSPRLLVPVAAVSVLALAAFAAKLWRDRRSA